MHQSKRKKTENDTIRMCSIKEKKKKKGKGILLNAHNLLENLELSK